MTTDGAASYLGVSLCAALCACLGSAQTVWQDRFIEVNGLRLHYLDWGEAGEQPAKPPFIMLHGISRVAHQFDHLAPHFAGKYHVIAIDMRGHGDSAWSPEGAYLVEDYVKDLTAFVDQLDLHGVTLLGNSTGGRVAQVYAGLHSERVARLIVEDVGPERTNEIASAFTRQVENEADGWATEDELVAFLKRGNAKTPDPILRSYAHFASRQREDGRVVWKRDPNLAKGFVPTELWRFVSQIKSPVLYVLGGGSRIVPPETQQKLKETLPHVQIAVMPGHGPLSGPGRHGGVPRDRGRIPAEIAASEAPVPASWRRLAPAEFGRAAPPQRW